MYMISKRPVIFAMNSFDNPVVWSILALGFVCYQLLTYYIIRVY